MEHLRKCTEAESFRVLGTKWKISAIKLDAFIALLYDRGAYKANNLEIAFCGIRNEVHNSF